MTIDEETQFYKTIKEANYFWIVISIMLSFVAFFSRAQRWKLALEPLGYETKFWHRYHAIMIGYLINFTIPRAGEASRAATLYQTDKVPFSTAFGSVIAERAIDFILLLFLAAFTAFIGYSDFFELLEQIKNHQFPSSGAKEGFQWKLIVFITMLIGFLFLTFFFIRKIAFRKKIIGFVKDVLSGLFSIFRLKKPLVYIGHTIIIWSCYILMFALPFYALPQTDHFPLTGILLGFIAGSLGIILTPGGIGIYPVLISLVVAFYIGEEYSNAAGIGNALGWIMWLSQTLIMIILGIISFILLPKNYSKENVETEIHTSEASN